LLEAMLSMLDFQASRWLMSGEVRPNREQPSDGHSHGRLRDAGQAHQHRRERSDLYGRFCRAIERPDLLTDARFATSRARSTNRDEIMEVLMPVTRKEAEAPSGSRS
jgi:formyl-CoA transferase